MSKLDEIDQPSLEEVKKRIEELNNLNLSSITIDEIKDKLTLLFTGYVISTPKLPAGLELYRGIKYSKKPTKVSKLSYPPADLANMSRAGRRKSPLFYASNSRNVPFFELDVEPGDRLVLSKWKSKEEILVNNIGYTDTNFSELGANRKNQEWGNDDHPAILSEKNVLVRNS